MLTYIFDTSFFYIVILFCNGRLCAMISIVHRNFAHSLPSSACNTHFNFQRVVVARFLTTLSFDYPGKKASAWTGRGSKIFLHTYFFNDCLSSRRLLLKILKNWKTCFFKHVETRPFYL